MFAGLLDASGSHGCHRWALDLGAGSRYATGVCLCISLGRVLGVEVHHRVGIRHYEELAWDHLLFSLMQSRAKVHRLASLAKLQAVSREGWEQQKRIGKPMLLHHSTTLGFGLCNCGTCDA